VAEQAERVLVQLARRFAPGSMPPGPDPAPEVGRRFWEATPDAGRLGSWEAAVDALLPEEAEHTRREVKTKTLETAALVKEEARRQPPPRQVHEEIRRDNPRRHVWMRRAPRGMRRYLERVPLLGRARYAFRLRRRG